MLSSDLRSELAGRGGYSLRFIDRGSDVHDGFTAQILRDSIPHPLPIYLPFDQITPNKFEQHIVITTGGNPMTVDELLAVNSVPATDMEIVVDVGGECRYAITVWEWDDTSGKLLLNN